jgi:HlyD family secretion protein
MDEPQSQRPSLTTAKNLELGSNRRRWRWIKMLIGLLAVAGIVFGVLAWRAKTSEASKPRYETAAAKKGNIEVTVAVTGKIQSVDSVEVGAEVSGRIDEVLVEFNDEVTKGQILAKINTEQLDARIKEVQAQSAVSPLRFSVRKQPQPKLSPMWHV